MKKEFEEIIKLAKKIGWDTTIDEDQTENYSVFTFTLIKPYQLDFSFSVEAENNSVYSLLDNIIYYYSAYDVSEETYLRLDEQGHGKKGYPYDMEEVLKIFNYREEEISKLAEHLTKNYNELKVDLSKVQIGDIVVCFDEYSHDYEEHLFKVEHIEEDEECGIKLYGTDLDCIDVETNEYYTDEYIGCVYLTNFVKIYKEEN